jgi:hypothetical protein
MAVTLEVRKLAVWVGTDNDALPFNIRLIRQSKKGRNMKGSRRQ